MIGELEMCSCGILFTVPIVHDKQLRRHFDDGVHERALLQPLCGPCFVGACLGCDGSRGGHAWRCTCDHARNVVKEVDMARISEIQIDWSNFLAAGAPYANRKAS